ncbi:MAG: hypothetical protein KF691_14700 [Phycisphaeraceae bacterium]|nr:hypothetical protein [Phycisphaeraceae bacterium]
MRKKFRIAALSAAGLFGLFVPLCLSACDKETSTHKSTTTKVTETPEGTKKTTETVERKVETERKDPN